MAGVPVIVHTFHGHVFHGYFSPRKTRLFILLEQICARISDTIIVLTEGQRDELADKYKIAPRDKFTMMGYGLDLDVFAQAPRKTGEFRRAWNIPPDAPLVTIVGRLVPVKNHVLFLNAAAKVLAQVPEAHFAIVGDGELREALEAQAAALGIRSAITFTGWQRDVVTIYADSDLLVISSVNEGTPFTVIEALATGCPVVASAVGGLPDFLDNGKLGVLVPSGDADALAAAIIQTLRQPPDAESLRTIIVEGYGVARLTRDLDMVYRELLAKKGVKANS
jgi:glycosyltransferase involved in cell wall biosynthesis